MKKTLKAQKSGGVLLRVGIMDRYSRGAHKGRGEQQQQDSQSTHCSCVGGCDKDSFRFHNPLGRLFPGSALGVGPAPPTCPASLGFCRHSLHLRRLLSRFGLTQIRFLTFAYIRAFSWTAARPPGSGHRRIRAVNIQFWSRAWANYWSVRWVPPLRETGHAPIVSPRPPPTVT